MNIIEHTINGSKVHVLLMRMSAMNLHICFCGNADNFYTDLVMRVTDETPVREIEPVAASLAHRACIAAGMNPDNYPDDVLPLREQLIDALYEVYGVDKI